MHLNLRIYNLKRERREQQGCVPGTRHGLPSAKQHTAELQRLAIHASSIASGNISRIAFVGPAPARSHPSHRLVVRGSAKHKSGDPYASRKIWVIWPRIQRQSRAPGNADRPAAADGPPHGPAPGAKHSFPVGTPGSRSRRRHDSRTRWPTGNPFCYRAVRPRATTYGTHAHPV